MFYKIGAIAILFSSLFFTSGACGCVQEQFRKRVGFMGSVQITTDDVSSESARPNRLHRRDTPHHLKNKRINMAIDRDKVASIIAQVSVTLTATQLLFFLFFENVHVIV